MNTKRIAFLATGDEIVNGDILNTNAQAMAHQLFDLGMEVGIHLVVSDTQSEIENAIHYLLATHDALVITGGLGPTSDDRTRFALASALNRELIFDEPSWEAIQTRLNRYNLKNQPISNRNQALFPEQATVIPNNSGTAAGCWVNFHDKLIFMLPGPPSECLPMFDTVVKPTLTENQFARPIIHRKWLLFNVSEGEIADRLDKLAAPFPITTGYRMSFPYVEFKIHSEDPHAVERFLRKAETLISSNMLNPESLMASELLNRYLAQHDKVISINDQATRGHLAKAITSLDSYQKIYRGKQEDSNVLHFDIEGIPEYWQGVEQGGTSWLSINESRFDIPFKGFRTVHYAVEFLSNELLKVLRSQV